MPLSFSLAAFHSVCLPVCVRWTCMRLVCILRVCASIYLYRCDIEERYLFKDIFSSYIYLIRTSAACYYIIIIIIIVGLFSFSLLLLFSFLLSLSFLRSFLSFVHIYSFHFGSWWKLPFRILFWWDFFCHLLLLMFMNLLFLCDTNDDFWLNETNGRARNETWFESNVRIIYFGFWFRSKATAAASPCYLIRYSLDSEWMSKPEFSWNVRVWARAQKIISQNLRVQLWDGAVYWLGHIVVYMQLAFNCTVFGLAWPWYVSLWQMFLFITHLG